MGELPGDEHGVSQIFIAVDYQKLVPVEQAGQAAERAVASLLASKPAAGTGKIIYTGEKTLEYRAENERLGIPVEESVWEEIKALAPGLEEAF